MPVDESKSIELPTVEPSVEPSVGSTGPTVGPSVSTVSTKSAVPTESVGPSVGKKVAKVSSLVIATEGSSDATKKIIAIVVIGALAAVIGVLYNQFPSYAATIMSGFVNAAMIFGGLMIVITGICIMMNVYKPDGFAITLFAGWLGMIGAWVIVPIYTVYHTFWPIKKRPYFGLFPAGFSLPGFGLIDMLLEPFHDGRDQKSYKSMLETAHRVLYGSSE